MRVYTIDYIRTYSDIRQLLNVIAKYFVRNDLVVGVNYVRNDLVVGVCETGYTVRLANFSHFKNI